MPLTISESPMKITGARNEPIRQEPRRVAASGAPTAAATVERVDDVSFLGIPRGELTPAVQAAIEALIGELDTLKREVGALRARLAEAEGLADRDALTPLLNRRAFVRELARARTFAERYGFPASLVYFDLDGFKALNDRLGHAAGDAALKAVAERLAANVRDSDVVGRMGGDEFAVVLVQADQATAEAKAATLAAAVEDAATGVTVSYGVREILADVDPETLIAEADAAMFAAKRVRKAG
jgi:diguanylate cyclase (GGDEF)-like protein